MAHRGQRVTDLSGAPLARVELEVASAGVIDDGVAINVVEGLLLRDEARSFADDQTQLHFPVERFLASWPENRFARIEDRVVPLGKDRGLLGGGVTRLLRMVPVVEPDADELARVIDGGMQPNAVGRVAHRLELARLGRIDHGSQDVLGGRSAFEKAPRALGEERGRDGSRARHSLGRKPGRAARFEVDHTILAHVAAEARGMAVLREADDLHMVLLGVRWAARRGRARNNSTPSGSLGGWLKWLVFPCYSGANAC